MKSRPASPSPRIYVAALRVLACALPHCSRADWLAEWKAEVWHVANSSGASHRDLRRFCAGAVSDVLCLKRIAPRVSLRHSLSPQGSFAALLVLAVLTTGLSTALPHVRHALGAPLYAGATRVVLISPPGQSESARPLLHRQTVTDWQQRRQHLFEDFAFYQPVKRSVHLAPHYAPELTVARASPNLFGLLGMKRDDTPRAMANEPQRTLLLTESAWRTYFAAQPDLHRQTFRVGLEPVRIGGVVPDETTPAAGHVDAWLIEPDASTETFPPLSHVFVVARLEPNAGSSDDRWPMSVPDEQGALNYDCVLLSARSANIHRTFLWAVLIALLSLPALSPVTSKEHVTPKVTYVLKDAARRLLFRSARFACVLVTAYQASLAIAFGFNWSHPETSIYLHLGTSFAITLAGVQWCLRDQSRRCPVCLNPLRHPARVGEPSRNFLGWNGIELVCTDGHGLLHVPEIQTSWFAEPRWLMLDPSWKALFPRSA